jgi:hypothetical protein
VAGVAAVVVDVPWSLPLLMSVCELVYIGAAVLPGDQNYALLSQAALSSCAIVASGTVLAHVQLAQELNSAALNAAEDTANAVRTAGALSLYSAAKSGQHTLAAPSLAAPQSDIMCCALWP